MVDRDDLEALDYLLWHRTGALASEALGCHQATVSRRLARCRSTFGLQLQRKGGDWQCGPNPLLALERHLHQLGRFLGQRPLRIEAFPIGSRALLEPVPEGWVVGPLDHVGVDRPLQLLQERVIDAWLCDASADLPEEAIRELVVLPLWHAPVELVASPGHPLAGERGLGRRDLLRFPSLDLPAEGFGRSRTLYRDQGFGDQPTTMRRYDIASWEGLTADQVTLALSTPINRVVNGGVAVLDAEPPLWNGGALLSRRDQADQPAIEALEITLRQRLRALAGRLGACALL